MPFSILVEKTRPRRKAIEKTAKKPRNPRIEALRLVAIVAIAVFHTFQPWFAAAADASSELALSFPWLGNTGCLAVLGWLNLLGAYGNHVFYLISGYFLLPSAISGRPLRTGRKVMVILVSVLFYATLSLLLGRIVTMESVSLHQTGWLLGGLEFIWVYLALVLLTPLMAQVARKLPQWRRAVLVLAGVVFGLNAYIAFVSPGEVDRGLLEWRKLMSAASYLVAYLTGAALSYEQARPTKAKRLLVGCILASAFIEGGAGGNRQSRPGCGDVIQVDVAPLVSSCRGIPGLRQAVNREAGKCPVLALGSRFQHSWLLYLAVHDRRHLAASIRARMREGSPRRRCVVPDYVRNSIEPG